MILKKKGSNAKSTKSTSLETFINANGRPNFAFPLLSFTLSPLCVFCYCSKGSELWVLGAIVAALFDPP